MDKNENDIVGVELSLSARNDGSLEAAYVRLRVGKVDHTKGIVQDCLTADYDAHGNLLGIELLGPIDTKDLSGLFGEDLRELVTRLLQTRAAEFVSAAA